VGATLECVSSNPAAVNPLPMPGGVDFESDSVDLGVATITVTPGGTLTGPNFAPRTGEITVVASAPAGFQLTLETVDEVPPPPPPPVE
jgi:hypothetical protein